MREGMVRKEREEGRQEWVLKKKDNEGWSEGKKERRMSDHGPLYLITKKKRNKINGLK
jgi:hypothetical protein